MQLGRQRITEQVKGMSEFERAKWPRQIIGAAVMGVLFVFLGFLFNPLYSFDPYVSELASYGVLPALFSIAGIWFGAWGIFAVALCTTTIYPFSASSHNPFVYGQWYFVYAFLPFFASAALSVLVPAFAFKLFKINLSPKTMKGILKSAAVFIIFGVIITSPISLFLEWVAWSAEHTTRIWPMKLHMWLMILMPNSLINKLIIGLPLLLLGSRIAIKARAICKGWFS